MSVAAYSVNQERQSFNNCFKFVSVKMPLYKVNSQSCCILLSCIKLSWNTSRKKLYINRQHNRHLLYYDTVGKLFCACVYINVAIMEFGVCIEVHNLWSNFQPSHEYKSMNSNWLFSYGCHMAVAAEDCHKLTITCSPTNLCIKALWGPFWDHYSHINY